jgi:carboxyl-terminal processing protease
LIGALKALGFLLVAVVFLAVAFGAGVAAAPAVRAQLAPAAPTPTGLDQQLQPLREAWGIVESRYVFKDKIDRDKMTYGAISGMLNTLDDEGHTRFLSPTELKSEESNLLGRFDGIGAEVTSRNGRITIVTPIDGSPAERAGIRPGDIIATIDGEAVGEATVTDVVNKIRGPRGTTVKLQVLHPGDTKLTDLSIVRDEIKVQMASWAMVPGTTVAHIKLSQFGQTVDAELRESVKAAKAAGATAIVVDVRNNPGGLLDQAIAVGSEFVDKGVLLQQEDRDGNRKSYEARPGGLALDLPMVVLTNEGSASASEIVAGAMQDSGRAKVVGATTFGTGTVLSSFELSDGSAMLLGTAQWLTPNGRVIRKQGIKPDVEVPMGLDVDLLVPRDEKTMTAEDFRKSPDVQLRRAVAQLDPSQPVDVVPDARGISAVVFPAR